MEILQQPKKREGGAGRQIRGLGMYCDTHTFRIAVWTRTKMKLYSSNNQEYLCDPSGGVQKHYKPLKMTLQTGFLIESYDSTMGL